ncbi:unnamed protein product [Eruca vesicaria subsp. sativa]|uniref:Uncharacterized protein n=1 Tax=Eruca vesicaria subsp. sativa TaxID=29727 RepID=A0ABC8JS97_ERUVS|nr:unnamed protein product [Eruca vesicaria subsp. sativa]
MLKRNRLPRKPSRIQPPATSRVRVKKPILIPPTNLLGLLHDVIQVRVKNQDFVLFLDPEREASLLLGHWSPGEGLGLSLCDDVFPEDGDGVERVGDGVVVGEAEGDGGGVEGAGEGEAVGGEGGDGGGGEVELDGIVELVGVDAVVDLGDVEVAEGGEELEEAVDEFEGGETELRWEDGV